MSFNFTKVLENFWHTIVQETEKEVIDYATPALKYIEANGGKAILMLAEGVLAGAAAGTPWATLIASLGTAAEAASIQLVEGAAGVVLNYAQSNLVATGTASGAAVAPAA